MFWVVALIYVRVPKTYLGGLFKTILIPGFMLGIASVGLGCGPVITPSIVLQVAQRPPEREMLRGMGRCNQYCLEPRGRTASTRAQNRCSASRTMTEGSPCSE